MLSDFDEWHIVLCNGLISDTEEEDVAQEAFYESLSDEEKIAYKEKNWERVFDISSLNNNWTTRGEWVQATFWELRREDVRAVRFFRTGKYKRPPEARWGRFDGTEKPPPLFSEEAAFAVGTALNPPTARARR